MRVIYLSNATYPTYFLKNQTIYVFWNIFSLERTVQFSVSPFLKGRPCNGWPAFPTVQSQPWNQSKMFRRLSYQPQQRLSSQLRRRTFSPKRRNLFLLKSWFLGSDFEANFSALSEQRPSDFQRPKNIKIWSVLPIL